MPKPLKSLVALALLLSSLFLVSCAKQKETLRGDELLAAAWNDYSLAEFDRATAKFEAARNDPSADAGYKLRALFGLATTWNLRRPGEDLEKAKALYEEVIQAEPAGDLAAWSTLALARMKHLVPVGDDPDYVEVRKGYQEVMDRFPGHLAAKEAFIYYNATLISSLDLGDARQAIKNLEAFVQDPKTEFLGPAYSLLAVANTTLGNQEKRLEMEIKSLDVTEVDPTNPFTEFSWQYWNIATIAEFEVGDFDTARTYYNKLIKEYPQDIKVFGARKGLERMDELEKKLREES
jgi:tetratricopeptide (TPR) repeat protein